jgi:hypothetical protein
MRVGFELALLDSLVMFQRELRSTQMVAGFFAKLADALQQISREACIAGVAVEVVQLSRVLFEIVKLEFLRSLVIVDQLELLGANRAR